jgi:hypothetical protein
VPQTSHIYRRPNSIGMTINLLIVITRGMLLARSASGGM